MTESEVDAVVREAMELVLERAVAPTGEVARADVAEWDSLKHVELVVTVEDACQVDLGGHALGELHTLTGIVAAVRAQLTGSAPHDRAQ